MALTAIRVPEWVHMRAVLVLARYRAQRIRARRMHRTGHLSLVVNPRWRLLSRDGGKNWQVMSHEQYNGKKDRK